MSLNALKLVLPPDTPRLANLGLHGGVFLFAAGVSILTGVLAGLVPAFQAGKRDLQGALRLERGERVRQCAAVPGVADPGGRADRAGRGGDYGGGSDAAQPVPAGQYRPGLPRRADGDGADLAGPECVRAEGFVPGVLRHAADARPGAARSGGGGAGGCAAHDWIRFVVCLRCGGSSARPAPAGAAGVEPDGVSELFRLDGDSFAARALAQPRRRVGRQPRGAGE